jgi:hypothetical protein
LDAATQQAVKLGADLVDAKSKADVVQLAAVQSSQRALADKCTQLQGACDRARTYVKRREAGWQLQTTTLSVPGPVAITWYPALCSSANTMLMAFGQKLLIRKSLWTPWMDHHL